MTVSVVLVDDHVVMREGLRRILEQAKDVRVDGESGDGLAAIELVRRRAPDVVVMDIAMPGLNGVEATRRIRAESPTVNVVALSAYADKRYVLAMVDAGAKGFVVKAGAAEELLMAVRAAAKGQSYLSPHVAGALVQAYARRLFPEDNSAYTLLSAREREVVQLLAEGKTSKEIAARLSIAAKTVEVHRRNVMKKLGLHSVADLTKYAVREGLTSLET